MWPVILILASLTASYACKMSVTTVSGTHAPHRFCSGSLIFSDDFNHLDMKKWQHENTLSGGGNWEFQYYNNDRSNSFVHDGLLFIRPSLTADQFGEAFLSSGVLNVDRCTNPVNWGCKRTGTKRNIINPVKSARLRTVNSFSFRYGRVEVRAKMPVGDWLWPAVWLLPAFNAYGTWPSSGEIDLVESRGNTDLRVNGVPIGTQEAGSTLHYGPHPGLNGWQRAHWTKVNNDGYDTDFHRYQLEWTPDFMKFSIDDKEVGRVKPGEGGFWEHAGFNKLNIKNPWRNGSKMAPFDQKFYLVINLAVGGTNGYFPDSATNPTPKPWSNNSPTALTDFWNGRSGWLRTWKLNEDDGRGASFQVDYARVWAL